MKNTKKRHDVTYKYSAATFTILISVAFVYTRKNRPTGTFLEFLGVKS
jgi:hypothetical protein